MPVLVVGGSLSGLVAAWRLQRSGVPVRLLESRSSTGGRFVREKLGGIEFEPAHAVIPASAPALFGLVHELGLGDAVRRVPLANAELASRGLNLEDGLVGFNGLRRRRVRRLLEWFGPKLDPAIPERGVRVDDRSINDFVRLYVSRRCAPGHLSPLFESQFGLPSGDTSRLLLMLLLDAQANLRVSNVFGLVRLADELRARLDDVRLESPVRSIAADGRSVELESGERLDASAVVCAVSAPRTRALVERLLPGERAYFDSARRVERAHVVVALSERLDSPQIWLEDGPLAAIIDATPPDHSGPGGLIRLVSRATDANDEELTERLLLHARRACPSLNRTVEATLVCRAGATPEFGIGHYRRVAGLRDAPGSGDRALRFADASLVAPHAEGTVRSAERAAAEICSLLSA